MSLLFVLSTELVMFLDIVRQIHFGISKLQTPPAHAWMAELDQMKFILPSTWLAR